MLSLPAKMKLRGYTKIVFIAVMMNQILTSLFTFFALQIDPATPQTLITGFGIMSCGLLGVWLQKDMESAFSQAKEKGLIRFPKEGNGSFAISPTCPRRWLVMLYIEIHPAVVGA